MEKKIITPTTPSIIRTPYKDVFEKAANLELYEKYVFERHKQLQGIIYQRDKKTKDAIRPGFLKILQNAKESSVRAQFDAAGNTLLTIPDSLKDHITIGSAVAKELSAMAQTYTLLTGVTDIDIKVLPNLTDFEETHDHDFDTLNCVWGGLGTQFNNRSETAGEGDWFFFREGFDHNTPETPAGATRLPIIALPYFDMVNFH